MGQRKKKANQRRQEEKEEVQAVIRNWSELCPDLLRCVFTNLNRAKLVCSSWYSASRGCVPKQNQIPLLILFPRKEEGNNNNNSGSCVLFVPDDRDNVYKTRDLGVDFFESSCLATYGSWLLMIDNNLPNILYILNLATGEKVDLPDTTFSFYTSIHACFRIDNRTKDYFVLLAMPHCTIFTKKGVNKWHKLHLLGWYREIFYNHKNQKLYINYYHNSPVKIWDFSGDKPREDGFLNHDGFVDWRNPEIWIRLAVTISGDVLMIKSGKTWRFRIFKANHVKREWVKINSLGDEALILDMGVTVLAKDIPGIKRNSIYFSGYDYHRHNHPIDDPKHIFVFDLTTQKIEELPQCVSSIQFSDARWFFPDYSG